MSSIGGVVESIHSVVKERPTGDVTVWLVKVSGVDYEYGLKQPFFKAGQSVAFEEEVRYNNKCMKFGTLAVDGKKLGERSGGSGWKSGSKESPEKLRSIARQNALTNAVKVYCAFLAEETPTISKYLHGKEMAAWILGLANKFAEFSTGGNEKSDVPPPPPVVVPDVKEGPKDTTAPADDIPF